MLLLLLLLLFFTIVDSIPVGIDNGIVGEICINLVESDEHIM